MHAVIVPRCSCLTDCFDFCQANKFVHSFIHSFIQRGMETVEKLTLENMGVAFGILYLGGTETEIHLGGHLPSPQLQRTF